MNNFYFVLCLMLCLCSTVSPSNILVVSPVASTSHFKIGESIALGLANAGHKVTIVSAYDIKMKNVSNMESIQISGAIERAEEVKKDIEKGGIESFANIPAFVMISILLYHGRDLCNSTLTDPNVMSLYNRKYDLVIVEIFGTDSLIGLGEKFNAPVIGYSTFHSTRWSNDLMGNPSPLSFVSHTMLDFPDRMNFFQRMQNTMFYIYESIVLTFLHHPLQRSVYDFAFPDAKISYDEARKNVALTFVNTHFTLASPLPYVPNIIEIGGIHVDRKKSPLPKDIEQFINSAKHGVIYFSFGSIVTSEQLTTAKRNAFINTFAKLKQKIIWKFEDSSVKMPNSVLARSWFPQSDILGHPNVIAFISHGGLLGLTEAAFHGCAVLGIPLFGDQRLNIKRATETGWAVTLDYNNISTISVEWALKEILEEKYIENAKTVSKRYRDQSMTPIETVVYWSEYVIRHKGAPYLRSPGLRLNYIQYHNLDVFAAMAAVVVLFVSIIKWIWTKICGGSVRAKVKLERRNSKKKQ